MWYRKYKHQFLKILEAEGRDLNAEEILPKQVFYYSGKFYAISKKFCTYINSSDKCRNIFQESHQHIHSEDVALGLCFQEFKKIKNKL